MLQILETSSSRVNIQPGVSSHTETRVKRFGVKRSGMKAPNTHGPLGFVLGVTVALFLGILYGPGRRVSSGSASVPLRAAQFQLLSAVFLESDRDSPANRTADGCQQCPLATVLLPFTTQHVLALHLEEGRALAAQA